MKNRFLMLCLVLATLVACNSDSMSNDDLNETANKGKAVPFKVKKMEGTYEYGPLVQNSISCDMIGLNAIGQGNVPHLGLTNVLEEWCWAGVAEDLGTRSITFTAANGDELWGEITSIVYTSPVNFIEEVTFIGGTGRFKNAEGMITQYLETSIPESDGAVPPTFTGTFTYNSEGKINY